MSAGRLAPGRRAPARSETSAPPSRRAALGFRAHSGWAALVVVAGPPNEPRIVDRRRIDLAGSGTPHTVQPYHEARTKDLRDAARVIQRASDHARRLAADAIRATVGASERQGFGVIGCGLGVGSVRPSAPLAVTLASHALVHAAEGLLFREALAAGAADCGLPVTAVHERELYTQAAHMLGVPVTSLRRRVSELGRALGPPWREDEKLATLAAWLALTAAQ